MVEQVERKLRKEGSMVEPLDIVTYYREGVRNNITEGRSER